MINKLSREKQLLLENKDESNNLNLKKLQTKVAALEKLNEHLRNQESELEHQIARSKGNNCVIFLFSIKRKLQRLTA